MAKVKYSPEANKDLATTKSYIENDLKNPVAAERILYRILSKNRLLETAPKIGTPLSSIIGIETEYRFLISGNYLSFYRYVENDNTCYIDRVLYIRRNYLAILFSKSHEPETDENDEEIGE